MIPNLTRILIIINILIPWPIIYWKTADIPDSWNAIIIAGIQFALVVVFFVWDEIWSSNYKKNHRNGM